LIDLKKEIARKFIHFLGLGYIPAYFLFGKEDLVLILITVFCLVCLIEFFRIKYGILAGLCREHERKAVGAHLYFGLAIIIVTLALPRDACFVALSTSIIGDGIAGIIKKMCSKNVATVFLVICSIIFIFLLNLANLEAAIFAVFIASIVERIEKIWGFYVNDNLTVPIAAGFTYYLVKYIFFPYQ